MLRGLIATLEMRLDEVVTIHIRATGEIPPIRQHVVIVLHALTRVLLQPTCRKLESEAHLIVSNNSHITIHHCQQALLCTLASSVRCHIQTRVIRKLVEVCSSCEIQ